MQRGGRISAALRRALLLHHRLRFVSPRCPILTSWLHQHPHSLAHFKAIVRVEIVGAML